MLINEPSDQDIGRIKSQFPDRSLHLVEVVDGEDTYQFVMTGPNGAEYQKYTEELLSLGEIKSQRDKAERGRVVVENAALALIKYPPRDEVRRIFDLKPAMSQSFVEEIGKLAGQNVEVRSKKL